MDQNEKAFFAEGKEKLAAYFQDRLLLIKLQTATITARLLALLFTGLVISLLSLFVLLFTSIMGGYYFAHITGSLFVGFGIIAAFYFLLLVLVIWFRKPLLEKKIIDLVIKVFFEIEEDSDEIK